MKAILGIFTFLISFNAFCSLAIYEKLNIEEVDVTPTNGYSTFKKEVGGLSCTKINAGIFFFSCKLDRESINAKAIYDVLNVKEQADAAPRTELVYKKVVGDLTCVKTDALRTHPRVNYECELKEE